MKKLYLIFVVFFFISFASAFSWGNMMGYYKLDETSGNVAYDSVGIYNATAIGTAQWLSPGLIGGMTNFTAGNKDFNTTIHLNDSISFTICSWVKEATANDNSIWGSRGTALKNYTQLQIKSTTAFPNLIVVKDGVATSIATDIALNNSWQFICSSFNNSDNNWTIYQNGKAENSSIVAYGVQEGDFYIGSSGGSTHYSAYALQDEISIFSRVLNSSDMTYLFNSGSGRPYLSNNLFYNYNGTNITLPYASTFQPTILSLTTIPYGKVGSTYYLNYTNGPTNYSTSFSVTTDSDLVLYFENDTGNYQETLDWTYKVFENSQTYSANTMEGSTEEFIINLTMGTGYRVTTGILNYNNTNYNASITLTGNTYLLRSITVPSVSVVTNMSFFWIINIDDSTQVNTSALNQSVGTLGIDNCSSFTNPLFNFTMYDEDAQTLLVGASENTSIKISFTLESLVGGSGLINYTLNSPKINPTRLCLQTALGGSQFRLDGVVEYTSDNRFTEYYYFQNYTLQNSTANVNFNLYNLLNSTGQEFKVTYKDSSFLPVSGVILDIQRKYVDEGLFKTIERPKTGSGGYTVGHFVRNDVIYNIIVYKEGQILATFNDVIAECQNPLLKTCEINLNSYGSSSLPEDFTNINDLSFVLSFNRSSRTVSTQYTIVSGVPATILLNVTLFDRLGNQTVCTDSLYSSGGLLSCVIPSTFGNSTVIARVFKDGSLVGQSVIRIGFDPSDIYGGNIILIAMVFFLIILGFGAASDSPMTMAFGLIIGAVVLVALNIIYSPSIIGTGSTILWFVVAVIIVLIKGSNRQ